MTGRPLVRDVASTALDAAQATQLRRLAAQVEPAGPPSPRQIPDGYRYRVDVWVDTRLTHFDAADPFIPPPLRELIQLVEQLGNQN